MKQVTPVSHTSTSVSHSQFDCNSFVNSLKRCTSIALVFSWEWFICLVFREINVACMCSQYINIHWFNFVDYFAKGKVQSMEVLSFFFTPTPALLDNVLDRSDFTLHEDAITFRYINLSKSWDRHDALRKSRASLHVWQTILNFAAIFYKNFSLIRVTKIMHANIANKNFYLQKSIYFREIFS